VQRPVWVTSELDVDRPNAARVYDYWLGGSHNLAADRELARQLRETLPAIPLIAQANRAFLRRAVLYCVQAGIRQFLDLGSGIPTVGNVHEVAQRAAPESRVVYVDVEPVAVAHARMILDGNDRVAVLQADIRDPDRILGDPGLLTLLDLSQPVAVLMVLVLPFIPAADDPGQLVARYRDAMAPGSHLVVSHGIGTRPDIVEQIHGQYAQHSIAVEVRSRPHVATFFGDFEMVEPGLVWVQQWRPDWLGEVEEHPEWTGVLGGVGRKP
jgi:hypothetical protein